MVSKKRKTLAQASPLVVNSRTSLLVPGGRRNASEVASTGMQERIGPVWDVDLAMGMYWPTVQQSQGPSAWLDNAGGRRGMEQDAIIKKKAEGCRWLPVVE